MWMMHVRTEHNSGRSMINRNSFPAPRSWELALHLEKLAKLGRGMRSLFGSKCKVNIQPHAVFNHEITKPGAHRSKEEPRGSNRSTCRTQAEQPRYPCSHPALTNPLLAVHSHASQRQTAHLLR